MKMYTSRNTFWKIGQFYTTYSHTKKPLNSVFLRTGIGQLVQWLRSVQTSCEVHPASYSWDNMGLMAKQQGYDVKHLPPPCT